jgi:ankyrin repeat protein
MREDNLSSVLPTPLHDAAARGNVELIQELIAAGVDCNEEDWTGRPPLPWAVDSGSIDAVRLLLKAGADPNGSGTSSRPFIEAAYKNRLDMMQLLLAFGATPGEAWPENSETALVPAAYHGNLEMVEWLLGLGVSPHVVARKGVTALAAAIESGHAAVAAQLRAAGAQE